MKYIMPKYDNELKNINKQHDKYGLLVSKVKRKQTYEECESYEYLSGCYKNNKQIKEFLICNKN